MFAALVKVRKKDFCIVLAGKHQIKSRERAPLRRDRDRPAKASTIWSRRGDYVETRLERGSEALILTLTLLFQS